MPILISCALVYLCAAAGLLPTAYITPPAQHVSDLLRFALFDVYFRYSDLTPIPPLWTMQYELAGSAIVFLVLAVCRRSPARFIVYAILTAALYVRFPLHALFVIGIVLAELRPDAVPDRARRRLAKAANLGFVPALISTAWLPGSDLHIWALVGSALAFCLVSSPQARALLSSRPSVFLGNISFTLYLLHALLIRAVGMPLLERASSPLEIALADLTVVTVVLLIAWLLRWIDAAGIGTARFVGGVLGSGWARVSTLREGKGWAVR